jgi:hypothetical protein
MTEPTQPLPRGVGTHAPVVLVGGRVELVAGRATWQGFGPSAELLHVGRVLSGAGHRVTAVVEPGAGLVEDLERLLVRHAPSLVVADRNLPPILIGSLRRMPLRLTGTIVDQHGVDLRTGELVPDVAAALAGADSLRPRATVKVARAVAAAAGVLVSGPAGRAVPPHDVVTELHDLDGPDLDGELVWLVGSDRLPTASLRALVVALGRLAPRFVRFALEVAPSQVIDLASRPSPGDCHPLPALVDGCAVLRIRASAGDRRDDIEAALRLVTRCVEEHRRAARPAVVLAPEVRGLDDAEQLLDLAEHHGVLLDPRWAPGVPDHVRLVGTALLGDDPDRAPTDPHPAPPIAESGTTVAALTPGAALVQLLGASEPVPAIPGALGGGPDVVLWSASTIELPAGLISPRSALLEAGQVPEELAGAARIGTRGRIEQQRVGFGADAVQFVAYRSGVLAAPANDGCRTVLAMLGLDDVEAFLADADRARQRGVFRRALRDPMVRIGEADAWRDLPIPNPAARLRVGEDGSVAIGVHGPVVGDVGDSWELVQRSTEAAAQALRRRRGCASCAIASTCSRDLGLSGLLSDAAYCDARRSRPWLPWYLAALTVLRSSVPSDDEVAVSGFGSGLHGAPASGWRRPSTSQVVLVRAGDRYLAGRVGGRRVIEIDETTAVVADLCLGAADLHAAVPMVATALGRPVNLARAAIRAADATLGRIGARLPGEARAT